MDLKQLEHFVAAADEQHFTRAARKMNIVQSGLSASIRALEQEMGAPLFVRTTRRVELTVAGRVLYEKAQQIIAGAREARRAVAAISGLERGTLSIGTCASLNAFFDLPLLLGEFHALHPAVEIRLCHSTAAKLMDKVKEGGIDLAFLPLYEKSREIVSIPIASDNLVVAHPLGHPLEGRESVALHSLAGETFVDFQLDQGTRRIVDRAFAAINVSRKTALEVGDVQVLLDLVATRLRHRPRSAHVRPRPRRDRDEPQDRNHGAQEAGDSLGTRCRFRRSCGCGAIPQSSRRSFHRSSG